MKKHKLEETKNKQINKKSKHKTNNSTKIQASSSDATTNSNKIQEDQRKDEETTTKTTINLDDDTTEQNDELDIVYGVETVDFAFNKNVVLTDIKLNRKWPVMVQLCSENLELFYSNKRNATKTYDFGLEIVEALSQLCEEFIAITTIFVHRSNIYVLLAPYQRLEALVQQDAPLAIGRRPPSHFAEKSLWHDRKYRIETSDFDRAFAVASKLAAKLTTNLAALMSNGSEVVLFRARVSQLKSTEQCLDYLGTCKGGCIIKRRKGRAYVAKLIYFGFLFSSSRSDQVDFLMASDGSSNFTLADRMVKLSNFLTLGRQLYNSVTAIEVLQV